MVPRVSLRDFAWAAGFLEGEGTFYACEKYRGNVQVSASQVEREPVDRLISIFGGTLHRKHYARHQSQWVWQVQGSLAVQTMMTLYALMYSRRKGQIREALRRWRSWGVSNKHKSMCKRDHLLSGENLYVTPSGRRECRICRRAAGNAFSQRRRAA